jgi:hypothetical protein
MLHRQRLLLMVLLLLLVVGVLHTGLWWGRAGRRPAIHIALSHVQVMCQLIEVPIEDVPRCSHLLLLLLLLL